ncbi:MAG: phosphate transport system regulatory protein PhoU [Sneathiella sp.]|nr:MAG: phosphate transport system regulatory protein PhoU [Sneathiella sp.]
MSGTGHTVASYDEDLEAMRNAIIEMGGMAEQQLDSAVRAFVGKNVELAAQTVAADAAIDELEHTIDSMAIRVLALRSPVAGDLRIVISALKIASVLERVADYATNIAKRVIALNEAAEIRQMSTLPRMGELVQRMISDTLKAYAQEDAVLALDVWKRDQEVDQLYNSMFRELLTYMMEDPRSITSCTHLIFMAKNIERIGDHMTNIAEIIMYQVDGALPTEARPKADKTSVTMIEQPSGS